MEKIDYSKYTEVIEIRHSVLDFVVIEIQMLVARIEEKFYK